MLGLVDDDLALRPQRPSVDLGAAVEETHSGIVFFAGDRAYKVKKPVDLGFLDFQSRASRERVCHREVELNRRLAPDVYLGVADVVDPDGARCDHLIVMRRMPADRRLSTLVSSGAPVDDHLWRLARVVAAFHERAERSPEIDRAASADSVIGLWNANRVGLAAFAGGVFDEVVLERMADWASRYVRGRRALFERRVAAGRAVDGHGDLLADDIFCLDDGPRVLDCLEFDDHLRYGDALLDIAFLAMDLERLGRRDLSERFLAGYRELSADAWPPSLADHYVAYRAAVRAKVAAIRHGQGDDRSLEQARLLLAMAHDHLDRGRVRLVLVGGLPGTGKSTLAATIGDRLGATVLRSDEVRKEIVGLSTGQPAPAAFEEGIYRPETTLATYRTLLDRASTAVELGETVVLDASWQADEWRVMARRVAQQTETELVEIRCVCPRALATTRLEDRGARGDDPSDATPAIADAMRPRTDPWPSARVIETEGSVSETVDRALDALA